METHEAGRIQDTNAERYQLAAQHGWQFQLDAPELTQRWGVLPFNQKGDKRIAFGVVSGVHQGLPFTMFDYHRRPVVTSVHTRWTNKKVNELDTIHIDSVWVITLPAAMPYFSIVSSIESTWDVDAYPEPPTPDRKFNRWYKLIDTDPNIAMQVLTPQVTSTMRQLKVHNWSLVGNELVYVQHPDFLRYKPDKMVEILGKVGNLVSVLPLHLGQHQAPPQQQYAQPPQQYAQPPQQYAQQPQQYAQPQQYQQPQYQQPPQQHGYPPQQGYPPAGPYGGPPPGY